MCRLKFQSSCLDIIPKVDVKTGMVFDKYGTNDYVPLYDSLDEKKRHTESLASDIYAILWLKISPNNKGINMDVSSRRLLSLTLPQTANYCRRYVSQSSLLTTRGVLMKHFLSIRTTLMFFTMMILNSSQFVLAQQEVYSKEKSLDNPQYTERKAKVNSLKKVLREFQPNSSNVKYFRCNNLSAVLKDVEPSSAHIALRLGADLYPRRCDVNNPDVQAATCEFDNGVCFVRVMEDEYVWLDTLNLCDCHAKCGDTPAPCN